MIGRRATTFFPAYAPVAFAAPRIGAYPEPSSATRLCNSAHHVAWLGAPVPEKAPASEGVHLAWLVVDVEEIQQRREHIQD